MLFLVCNVHAAVLYYCMAAMRVLILSFREVSRKLILALMCGHVKYKYMRPLNPCRGTQIAMAAPHSSLTGSFTCGLSLA